MLVQEPTEKARGIIMIVEFNNRIMIVELASAMVVPFWENLWRKCGGAMLEIGKGGVGLHRGWDSYER